MVRRSLPLALLVAAVAIVYCAAARTNHVPLTRPELAPFFGFLIAVSLGIVYPQKLQFFAIASPLLAVAVAMRGVFTGAGLYANYAIYATFFSVFAASRAALAEETKRVNLREWAVGTAVIAAVGWAAFLAVQILAPV